MNRTWKSIWVCLVMVLIGSLAATFGAATPEEIAQAVKELGDEDFRVREKASAFLWAAGKAAEAALQEAVKGNDPEVSQRARAILDKFKWGIYPDTPKEVADRVTQYRYGDRNQKQAALEALFKMGRAGYAAWLKLAVAEQDPELRRSLFQYMAQETAQKIPDFLLENDYAAAEQLLELGAASDIEPIMRGYAVFLLLREKHEEKIRELRARVERAPESQSAQMLTHLYRAKGDLASARWAAEKSGKAHLVRQIVSEQGDWKALLEKHRVTTEARSDIEWAGFWAAYNRLLGNQQEFEEAVGEIRKFAEGKSDDSADPWFSAEALLINERLPDAIPILIKSKNLRTACELLCGQQKFREAFALADKATPETSKDLIGVRLLQARTLYSLGEKEKATTIFSEIAKEVRTAKDTSPYEYLVETESRLGLKKEAFEHCAWILEARKGTGSDFSLLGRLFPQQKMAADVWWKVLRTRHADVKHAQTLARLRDLLDTKLPATEVTELAAKTEETLPGLQVADRERWLLTFAETCANYDRDELADRYFDQAVQVSRSSSALLQLADYLSKKKRWQQAAEKYREAWDKDRKQAAALYLSGWALVEAGQGKEGRSRIELARLLPLANEQSRHMLAESLSKHGLHEAARAERELILRSGQFESWEETEALRRTAVDAVAKKDYLAAANYYERFLFRLLRTPTGFTETIAYLLVPHWVHNYRARGLMAAGRADDAVKEAERALAILPANTDLPIALVPQLEKAGKSKEAETIFAAAFDIHDQVCREFPKAATHHNNAAWLAARCRKRLDQGLEHALKAIALAPDNAGYLDTLAEVNFQRGDKAKAIELMRKCIELNPKRQYFRKQLARFEAGDPAVEVPVEEERSQQ